MERTNHYLIERMNRLFPHFRAMAERHGMQLTKEWYMGLISVQLWKGHDIVASQFNGYDEIEDYLKKEDAA